MSTFDKLCPIRRKRKRLATCLCFHVEREHLGNRATHVCPLVPVTHPVPLANLRPQVLLELSPSRSGGWYLCVLWSSSTEPQHNPRRQCCLAKPMRPTQTNAPLCNELAHCLFLVDAWTLIIQEYKEIVDKLHGLVYVMSPPIRLTVGLEL